MPAGTLFAALVLMGLLLLFETRRDTAGVVTAKPLLSVLFVLTALLQPWPVKSYALWMLGGFAVCVLGDIFLIFSSRKMFLMGLAAFLAGHLFFVTAFFTHAAFNVAGAAAAVLVLVAGGAVYRWLHPHLGNFRMPVIVYMLVISAMVVGAAAIAGGPWAPAGKVLVLTGALSFYASDIFVARDKFVHPSIENRWIGLPLYYLGQFLLAVSVGHMA